MKPLPKKLLITAGIMTAAILLRSAACNPPRRPHFHSLGKMSMPISFQAGSQDAPAPRRTIGSWADDGVPLTDSLSKDSLRAGAFAPSPYDTLPGFHLPSPDSESQRRLPPSVSGYPQDSLFRLQEKADLSPQINPAYIDTLRRALKLLDSIWMMDARQQWLLNHGLSPILKMAKNPEI